MILKLAHPENESVDDAYWDDMRSRDYSTSFPAIKDLIHQNSSRMSNHGKRRNKIVWALAVLLPFLIFFSCKRKTYIEPQGTTLSFIANDSAQSNIELIIKQSAEKPWRVVFRSHAGTMHGTIKAPGEAYSRLKAFVEKLRTIPGVKELYLSDVTTTVKESPISRLSYRIFNQHLDATSASADQLQTALERKLKQDGLDSLIVQMMKDNGALEVKLVGTGQNQDFSIDIALEDGTKVSAISEKWQ